MSGAVLIFQPPTGGGAAPANVVLPSITGTTVEGSTLTVAEGTWINSPTPPFTYQWRRGGTPISGATGGTYTLVSADVGATITCAVTGSNAFGSATAVSGGVGPVTAAGGPTVSDIGPVIPTARVFISGHSLSSHIGQTYDWATGLGVNHQFERNIVNSSPIEDRTGSLTGFNGLTDGRGDWSGSPAAAPNWLNEWETPTRVTGGKYTHLMITERHDSVGPLFFHDTIRNLIWYGEAFADRSALARLIFWHPMRDPNANPSLGFATGGLNGPNLARWISYEKIAVRYWEAVVERVNLTARNKNFSWRFENAPMAYILARLLEECRAGSIPSITGTDAALAALFTNDGVHPNTDLGHYVVACVHAAVVHRKNITGLMGTPSGVSAARALAISTFVWNELVAYYNGGETRPTMAAARTFMDSTFKPAHDAHMNFAVYSAGYFVSTNDYTNPFFFDSATDTTQTVRPWFAPPLRFTANRWSDPATWGGSVPGPGANVTISSGQTRRLDTNTAALGNLVVDAGGTLLLDGGQDVSLTCASFVNNGTVRCGTAAAPFGGRLTITLTGTNRNIVVGSAAVWELFAVSPLPHYTILNANANTGATALAIANNHQEVTPPVSGLPGTLPPDEIYTDRWYQSDELGIGPSDFYAYGRSEVRALGADARPAALTLATGLSRFRWGAKQYVNESAPTGVSLTRQASFAARTTPTVTLALPHDIPIDERAPIANLSRRIVIQGANDSQWTGSGNGVSFTINSRTATFRLDGVVLRRCGQRGTSGRYPIFFDMESWSGSTFLGDVPTGGQYVRRCVIRESENRAVYGRGTYNVEVTDNIAYSVKGHAFFMDEGTCRKWLMERNMAMTVDAPAVGNRLAAHERPFDPDGTVDTEPSVAGFVITNGDNRVADNWTCDSQGHGFWYAPPPAPYGASASVPIFPSRCNKPASYLWGKFISHSHQGYAGDARMVPTDTAGTVLFYWNMEPTADESATETDSLQRRSEFEEHYHWKAFGYANRGKWVRYHRWTSSSIMGRHLFGATLDRVLPADGIYGSRLDRGFVIGETLNNANPMPYPASFPTWLRANAGVASYHFSFAPFESVFVNLQTVAGLVYGGMIDISDLYERPVETGWRLGPRNLLINSTPGHRTAPFFLGGQVGGGGNAAWVVAGAKWDIYGYYGVAGTWSVFNIPFFTHGQTISGSSYSAASATTTAISVTGSHSSWIGFANPYVPSAGAEYNDPFLPRAPLRITRLDSSNNPVSGPTWDVATGVGNPTLFNKRHFSAANGGRYRIEYPGLANPTHVEWIVENMFHGAGQSVLVSIQFDGGTDPVGSFCNGGAGVRALTSAASLAAVEAGSGNLYWRDVANNRVWVKLVGDLPNSKPAYPTDPDRGWSLVIRA